MSFSLTVLSTIFFPCRQREGLIRKHHLLQLQSPLANLFWYFDR
jgi:hypothetical protein